MSTLFECSIAGCFSRKRLKRGFCQKHYQRLRKFGDPLDAVLPGRRRTTVEHRFWEKVSKADGQGPKGDCWEWQAGRDVNGYGKFRTNHTFQATHYAWFSKYGKWPKNILRHTCDNPPCVNVRHLLEGTTADNAQDMKERGRSTKGERSGVAKLTNVEVRNIRHLRSIGVGQREVGRRFNISHTNVGAIERRETWVDI